MFKEKYEKSYLNQQDRIKEEIKEKAIVQRDKFHLLKSMLPERFDYKIVLDVGGGAGALAVQIAAESQCAYITIDISFVALKLAKLLSKKLNVTDKVDFIVADAHRLPIKTDSVDLVILTDVLEHVMEPQNVLIEARNALCNRGYLYLTVPYAFGPETILMDDVIRLTYALKLKKAVPTHLSSYTERRLRAMLASSGFKSMESRFYPASYTLFILGGFFSSYFKNALEKTVFQRSCLAMYAQASEH
ncbi:MAG: class I SAM-dependent methyltransferase [Candidatus Bathyarchaeia archaeon]|jgi:ubiquinone/menaquinone biosynthesis C-methylase UbiE